MTSRYKKGRIYKIIDNTNNKIYIGSTCKALSQRLAQHRYDYKQYLLGKMHFITSMDILKNNNYGIVLIEEYPCDNKEQLLSRERHYIEISINCVNKAIPMRTHGEYYQANIEHFKQYREQNKERMKVLNANYWINNKERLVISKKKHYEENIVKIKEYRERNKDIISEKAKVKCECICGSVIRKKDYRAHLKTQKHQNYIQKEAV